jgi:phage shock protein PspC (stress-responsive transcriptional regulator)
LNKIYKAILVKLGWVFAAFIAFYMVGLGLGIVPQYAKDTVQWGADNFLLIVFFVCFIIAAYLVNKHLSPKKEDHE